MKRAILTLVVLATGFATGAVRANPAYTQGITHLRAGPSADYPLVTSLPPNTLLNVNGCLDDYTWCDVDWQGNRGWVYGDYLLYDYQNQRVPVLSVGAALGIGIVAFSIGDYWGRYYTGRPWYRRESYWMHRPPPPRHPPHRPGFGPGGGHRPGVGPGRPPPRPSRPNPPPRPRPPAAGPSPGRPNPGHGNGGRPQRPETKPAPRPGGGGPGAGGGRPGQGGGAGSGHRPGGGQGQQKPPPG